MPDTQNSTSTPNPPTDPDPGAGTTDPKKSC